MIAHRTDDNFAATAKQKGTVKKVTKEVIVVEYEDGTERRVALGRTFGSASGSTYPHLLETQLVEGETFVEGDCLAYNSNFFEPDPFNRKEVLWKAGVMTKVALVESTDTFEDSSAISERISKEMTTAVTKVRTLFFNFEQEVKNLVEIGEKVTPETILCTIEDAVGSEVSKLDEKTTTALQLLSANTPRAKHAGVVEKIVVTYHGNKDDMSESLRKIADASDKVIAKKRKALNKPVVTGQVRDSIRIDSTVLEVDQAVVEVFISKDDESSTGDKGVFGGQMKTVFARVMSGVNETESGESLDALFSYASIDNRIVYSPFVMGTTNTLLRVLGKRIAQNYLTSKTKE